MLHLGHLTAQPSRRSARHPDSPPLLYLAQLALALHPMRKASTRASTRTSASCSPAGGPDTRPALYLTTREVSVSQLTRAATITLAQLALALQPRLRS